MVILLLACTDSKRALADPRLKMQAYEGLPFPECREAWRCAKNEALPVMRAGQLYKGGYWAAATRARVDAAIPMRALVVSAGLGLVDVIDPVPSYAATFTPGSVDSIPGAGKSGEVRLWWSGIGGMMRFRTDVLEAQEPRVICALPFRYLDAIQPALRLFIDQHGAERLVVLGASGSAARFPEFADSWVSLDLRMVRTLGGTAGQLTARSLRWVCEQLETEEQVEPAYVRGLVDPLIDRDAPPLYPKRTRCSPEEVRAWILAAWVSSTPPSSATGALRMFRASGNGFEQKRFNRLYKALLAEKTEVPDAH